MENERRQFNRVTFDADASLKVNDAVHPCKIIDLSLHGALVSVATELKLAMGSPCELTLALDESDQSITMSLHFAHQKANQIGLECEHIDLDSMTHLRRLLELNLGETELLDRDFEALCQDNT